MRFPLIAFFLIVYVCYIPAASARPKYIFSIENKLRSFESDDQCKNLRVIDARTNKDNLGFLRLGEFDGLQAVVTKHSIDTFFQDLYNRMKVDAKSNDDELIMVLYKLEMHDKPAQIGTLCFSADFFRGKDEQYRLLASVDSLYEVNSVYSVTNELLGSIRKKLPDLLAYYAGREPVANTTVYSFAQLARKRNDEKMSYPVYSDTQFKKGIYYTPDDFLNNKAVDTPIVLWSYLSNGGRFTKFYYKDEKGKRGSAVKETSFFAVYDGKDWWLNDTIAVRKLTYVDGDFYTVKYFKQAHTGRADNGAVYMGLLGGALGALIVASISDAVNVDKIITSRAPYKAMFNPVTKQFVPISRAKKY